MAGSSFDLSELEDATLDVERGLASLDNGLEFLDSVCAWSAARKYWDRHNSLEGFVHLGDTKFRGVLWIIWMFQILQCNRNNPQGSSPSE
jgi:hypothetical protein